MYRTVAVFLLVSIASVALAQSPPSLKKPIAPSGNAKSAAAIAAPPPSGPSICVTSIIGHKFDIKTIGLMVFGNSLETVDTTSWGLDELVVRKIGVIVGGHFAVRRLVLNKVALAAYEAPKKSILEGGPLFRDAAKEFVDMLKTAAALAPKCNLYLVIGHSTTGYGNTNQYLRGIGILNHDTGIFSSQSLFAVLYAQLYDGATFEVRTTTRLRTGSALEEVLTRRGLYRSVDKSWLPNPPQGAAQNFKLRDAIWALIEPALANTVPALLQSDQQVLAR
jgi:hypothetical protein